jgi:hypothetical protein
MQVTPPIHSLVPEDQTLEARVDAAPEHVHMESAQTTENAEIHAPLDTVMILARASEMRTHITERSMIVVLDVHSQRLILVIATSAIQHLVWVAMMDGHRIPLVSATRLAQQVSEVCQGVSQHANKSLLPGLRMVQLQLFTSVQFSAAMCILEALAHPE